MTKKILALALAAMMICTCMISVNAVEALPELAEHGYAIPSDWTSVDVGNTDMVRVFHEDGTDCTDVVKANNDKEGAWIGKDGITADGGQIVVLNFNGGHLIDSHGYNFNRPGPYIEFTFTGTAVALVSQFTNTPGSAGTAEIYIDGELKDTVAPTAPDFNDGHHIQFRTYFQADGLTAGKHTLKVLCTAGNDFSVDQFLYVAAEVEAPSTGDASIAAIAIAAVASMGAVLVIGKKR